MVRFSATLNGQNLGGQRWAASVVIEGKLVKALMAGGRWHKWGVQVCGSFEGDGFRVMIFWCLGLVLRFRLDG